MNNEPVRNFTVLESIYGRFIVNRYCDYQAEALVKTGATHIETELGNIFTIINVLPDNSVIIDGGANAGFFSIPVGKLIHEKKGIVYAFEPQRMIFNALCGSVALNDLENIVVINKGLGSGIGSMVIPEIDYSRPADFGQVSLKNHPGDANQVGENVEITTIDNLKLPRLDFLKLDIEGMEIDALDGARQSIERFLPWCWIEYWKVGQEKIVDSFSGLKYRFFLMDRLNMLVAPPGKLEKSGLVIGEDITELTITKPQGTSD